MKKTNRFKRIVSLVLALGLLLSMIPEKQVFAAGNPTVTAIRFIQNVSKGPVTVNTLFVEGTNLNGATPIINGTEVTTDAGKGITVTQSQSGINITIEEKNALTILRTNQKNKIAMFKDGNISSTYVFNVPIIPTIDSPTDKKVYEGEPLTLTGGDFVEGAGSLVQTANLVIAGQNYTSGGTGAGQFQIVDNKTLKVTKLNAGQRNSYQDIEYKMTPTAATAVGGEIVIPDVSASTVLKESLWVIPSIAGLTDLKVVPSKGPISGNTLLTVTAADNKKFTDAMEIVLRSVTNPDKEFRCTYNQLQKAPDGTVLGLEGVTPLVTSTDIGKYDLVIREPATGREAVKKLAFEYVEAGNYLGLKKVEPNFAKETEEKQVQVVGRNIFNINTDGVSNYTTDISNVIRNGPNNDRFIVTYQGFGSSTYEGKAITNLVREVEVRIGAVATPIPEKPSSTSAPNTTYTTSSEDGLLVKTPKITKDKDYYNVVVETKTLITTIDGTKEVIERTMLPNYFRFDTDRTEATVTSVEPIYGYYNDRNSSNLKPLMVRVKGSNFQIIREETSTGSVLKMPEVTFYSGVTPIEAVYTKVVAVLQGGNPIDGVYKKIGDELVVEIWPIQKNDPSSTQKLSTIIQSLGQSEADYKKLDVTMEVKNPDQGTKKTPNPVFQFRYTTDEQKWPEIKGLYYNGKEVNILNTSEDMKLELKVKTQNKDKLILTVDGKPVTFDPPTYDADGLAVLKFKAPKGRSGMTRVQVIAEQGLMDSLDVEYKSFTTPAIKEIIPTEGISGQTTPVMPGTTIIIKRDTQKSNVVFRKPDKTATDPDLKKGTAVLFGGKNYDLDYYSSADKTNKATFDPADIKFVNSPIFKDPSDENGVKYLELPTRYTAVIDNDTILFRVPDGLLPGVYKVQVQNPDGGINQEDITFTVVNTFGKYIKIKDVDPNKGDYKGGIIATVTADIFDGKQTNFTPSVDIYFGSQKAEVIGYNLDSTEAYVKVPELKDKVLNKGESYYVNITAVNTENKATDTLINGYKYVYPSYDIDITNIRKDGMSATDPDRNKGTSAGGDKVFVEGLNFMIFDENGDGQPDAGDIYPSVYFGKNKVKKDNIDFVVRGAGTDPVSGRKVIYLERVKVITPPGQDGPVDVVFINPDGATAIEKGGFIYAGSKPVIDEKASTLTASRFYDRIDVFAKEVFRSGLMVGFGGAEKNDGIKNGSKEIGAFEEEVELGAVEKIVVKYTPGAGNNIQLMYVNPDKTRTPMNDAYLYNMDTGAAVTGSSIRLDMNETKFMGIKWNNAAYHKNKPVTNAELLSKLNDEYIRIRIFRDGTKNVLEVRRGFGKIESFTIQDPKENRSAIRVLTPYNEKPETTKIYLINADGSQAEAPFIFTGGLDQPQIISVPGAKDREVEVNGNKVQASVYTSDINLEGGVMKIEGENFKDIQEVKIGGVKVDIDAIDPYNKWILVKVPKGTQNMAGKPQIITVTTKEGNAYSDVLVEGKRTKPIYFMYIIAGTTPKITSVTPKEVVETGGNIIEISGTGFSRRDEFGEITNVQVKLNGIDCIPVGPAANVDENEYVKYVYANPVNPSPSDIAKIIIKKVPPTTPGKGTVTLINADGGSAKFDEVTVITQPIIEKVIGPGGGNIFFNDTTGEITIIGKQFNKGAKVFIGSTLVPVKDYTTGDIKATGVRGVETNGRNKQMNIIGGYEGVDVVVENSISIKFKLPKGIESMPDKPHIYIINTDTGIGDGGESSVIEPPVPSAPTIKAVAGYNRTITLYWTMPDKTVLNKPKKFEIYGRQRGNDYTYIGDVSYDETQTSTTTSSMMKFLVKDLKSDTRYYFKVRVLNEYGESKDLGEADATTLTDRQDYKETEKLDKKDEDLTKIKRETKFEVSGDKLIVTTGTRDTEINMNKVEYAKYTTRYIQVPISQIKEGGTIRVVDKGITLGINLSNLDVKELQGLGRRDDAVFRIKLQIPDKRIEEGVTSKLPKGTKKASRVYSLGFEIQNGTEVIKVQSLRGTIDMTLQYEPTSYGTFSKINLAKYDEAKDKMNAIANGMMVPILEGGYYVLLGQK